MPTTKKLAGALAAAATDEAVLTIPPGGSDRITLDSDKQAKLAQRGWVKFFALKVN